MAAKGSAEWKGDLPGGSGTFTAGDSISGGYTFKSRFEDGPGSNPEQLIAAAHAACFSMALSNILASAGSPPESVQTDATVTLRFVDGAPTITKIALVTTGRVPGIDQATFAEHAATAKAGCPVSRALAAVPEITLEATLALSGGRPMSACAWSYKALRRRTKAVSAPLLIMAGSWLLRGTAWHRLSDAMSLEEF